MIFHRCHDLEQSYVVDGVEVSPNTLVWVPEKRRDVVTRLGVEVLVKLSLRFLAQSTVDFGHDLGVPRDKRLEVDRYDRGCCSVRNISWKAQKKVACWSSKLFWLVPGVTLGLWTLHDGRISVLIQSGTIFGESFYFQQWTLLLESDAFCELSVDLNWWNCPKQ